MTRNQMYPVTGQETRPYGSLSIALIEYELGIDFSLKFAGDKSKTDVPH